MRSFSLCIGVAAMAIAAPAFAQQGNGHGKGGGGGGDGPGKHEGGGPGKGNKADRGDRGAPQMAQRGGGDNGPGKGRGKDKGPAGGNGGGKAFAKAERGKDNARRDDDRGPGYASRTVDRGNNAGKSANTDDRRDVSRPDRIVEDARGDRKADRFRYDTNQGGRYYASSQGLIDGCPPGLAKKNNGCLPPGQARKIFGNAAPADNWYGDWSRYRNDNRYDWRYDNGYMYRVNTSTSLVDAFRPLLGGALFGGNSWPTNYTPADYQVSPYYSRYYGYDQGLDYRYADGAILGVNPQTQQIDGIAALLTGNQWTVGSQMPAGYDLYNMPPAYRSQYADTPDSMYRYSDGYAYQVDPKTQLIQKAIQLLGNVL